MPFPPNASQSKKNPSPNTNSQDGASTSPDAQRMIQRFAQRFEELRQALTGRDPRLVAQRCGADFVSSDEAHGKFHLLLWGAPISVTFPEYQVYTGPQNAPASLLDQAFLLYYFTTADGAPLENRWVAFSDLPDGRFYNQAFQGYTGKELARHFGEDRAAFESAALALGGRPAQHADAAFTFQALPRVPVMSAYWLGDEDFPSTSQILFDAAAGHYLPPDAYAILGSMLTRRLIKASS